MTRRIMAAALAGVAIVTVSADRLPGASTPTTTGPTTTTTGPTTTTTNPLASVLRPVSRVNPNHLYPRRSGAKYEDAEVGPNATATLNPIGPSLRVERAVVRPAGALPADYAPSPLDSYRELGLVDGYVPVVTRSNGDLLSIVVRVSHSNEGTDGTTLRCTATTSDGSVLVPLARPAADEPARTTTTTIARAKPFDLSLWFPLGARRGRVYLTCTDGSSSSFLDFGSDSPAIRAVWGLDV